MPDQIDTPQLRSEVRSIVERSDEPPTKARLINLVAAGCAAGPETVAEALDELEREGFIYCVGEGTTAEVKRP